MWTPNSRTCRSKADSPKPRAISEPRKTDDTGYRPCVRGTNPRACRHAFHATLGPPLQPAGRIAGGRTCRGPRHKGSPDGALSFADQVARPGLRSTQARLCALFEI